jgi:hypothetical protein
MVAQTDQRQQATEQQATEQFVKGGWVAVT